MDRPAKICQFDNIVDEHDIFRFQISVDDTMRVQINESFDGLFNIDDGLSLTEIFFLSESIPQRAAAQLNNQI
jgi:hypothetical protein